MSTSARIPPDARDWIALAAVKGIGPGRFMQLVSAFGSPGAALAAGLQEWLAIPGFGEKTGGALSAGPDQILVDQQLCAREKTGASMAVLGSEDYPALLAKIPGAPPFFFYRGEFTPADERAVAVVGARTPTPYGRRMATEISDGLARAGLTIVSGLAHGVDGLAHEAALNAGARTIAVFGCGLNVIYPKEHRALAERITQSGVIMSEFPFGAAPVRENFPKRNRIISGFSLGVVIVEARGVSGALLTAQHALEQNREVFAVPGPAGSELSEGTNNLIKAGARLITEAADVLAELGMQPATRPVLTAPMPHMTPLQERVYRRLGETPCHIDELSIDSSVSAGELSTILLDLELLGVVGQVAGKRFYRVR